MIHARRALLPSGWAEDVRVALAHGLVARIESGAEAQSGDTRVDTLLPAPANLHSHTFQRAMAGLTEWRAAGRETFWTWRDLMYRFVGRLTPEQVEAIAALAFVEMQEAGFAAVGEFHYVHHQPCGASYENPAELSGRILAAAQATGIGLTHLPVLYSYGGAGGVPLSDAQRRFGADVEGYLHLVEAVGEALSAMPPDTALGMAPHSLRATTPEDLHALLSAPGTAPVHIHIAEQPREVAEIEVWLGARPVEWLLGEVPVDARWCLVHATHMTPEEVRALAASGAVAGLCPITEANLGDGPFEGAAYLAAGGAFGVGTDSNVRISLGGELRALEYSQRLRDLSRTVLAPADGSVGLTLYTEAARGGAQALGRNAGEIAVGRLADLLAIDSTDPTLCILPPARLLDGFVFCAGARVVREVWSAGRHCVQDGRHVAREPVVAAYRAAVAALLDDI